jgi:phage FluMu protein Com
MAKEIICPHCKRGLAPSAGFDHDENLNMLCVHCKNVVFAASKETESKVKHLLYRSEGQQHWQKKDCLPIRMQPSSTIVNASPPSLGGGYEMYGD